MHEEACTTLFMFLSAWGDEDSDATLVTRALERSNADVLLDTKVKHEMAGVPPFYSRECRVVEGRPAKLAAGGAR